MDESGGASMVKEQGTRYDPNVHHRRFIRLKGYDYTQAGAYFITICTQHRECLFGAVRDGEVVLNDAGRMVRATWGELLRSYRLAEPDAFVVMPNHFHGVVILTAGSSESPPLPVLVRHLKSLTTLRYCRAVEQHHWPAFSGRMWQRNYFEHVLRDDDDLCRIREYIANNPARWADDEYHA